MMGSISFAKQYSIAVTLMNISCCRDQFFSAAGMNDIMSASAIIVFSSIPIVMHPDEIKILLQV